MVEERPGLPPLARSIGFPTDAELLAMLQRPFSLSYVAAHFHTSMERVRGIRDAHKTEIVTARLQAGQKIEGVALQLDLVQYYDRLQTWYTNTYLKEHEHAKD